MNEDIRNEVIEEAQGDALVATEGEMSLENPEIQIITTEIRFLKAQAGAAILEIGRRLNQAKAMLQHGEWSRWLEEKAEFSAETANRFMRLAREYPNQSPVTDLGASKALILLALPASEREDFVAEKHEVNGKEKTVAEMSKRELEKVIKERDAALQREKDAQAAAEQMKQDAEAAKARADEAMKALEDVRETAKSETDAAEAEVAALKEELEALQNAPAPAAEPDKAILSAAKKEAAAQARKEAEDSLKKRIEKAEQDKKKAEEAKAKAEQELAAQKVALEQAGQVIEREKADLAGQVDELRKKLAMASSSEISIFKLHFEAAQNAVNKMMEALERMREGGDAQGAEKMKNALVALLDATKGALK